MHAPDISLACAAGRRALLYGLFRAVYAEEIAKRGRMFESPHQYIVSQGGFTFQGGREVRVGLRALWSTFCQ